MPRIPVRAAALLPILVLLLSDSAFSEGERRYRMYRNPPKPRLALVPVASRSLDKAARKVFDLGMAREVHKLKDFHPVDLPDQVRPDSLGRLPLEKLSTLRDRHHIDLLLQSNLERSGDRNVLYARIIDTRNGDIRADYREECRCPVDSLISSMLPETLRQLSVAPKLKGLRCTDGMALIPGVQGPGPMESDTTALNWSAGTFCIDLYEYPNQPSGEPVVEKTWNQADSICAGEGKRLCTEGEWELACGGWKDAEFPYGGGYQESQCNTQSQTIQLSGGKPGCRSPFGVFDLSGNVYEWTSSKWSSKYGDKVVKGGNWNSGAENSSCRARFGQPSTSVSKAIGFRCCQSLSR